MTSPVEVNGVVVYPNEYGYIPLQEAQRFIGDLGGSADNAIGGFAGGPAGELQAESHRALCMLTAVNPIAAIIVA